MTSRAAKKIAPPPPAQASPPTAPAASAAPVLLSAADILGANDYRFEDVDVPEWGGVVRIKALTGAERDKFEASTIETKGKSQKANLSNLRAKLVVWSAIDANGDRLFQPYQIDELGRKSAAALDRCFSVAQKLSKISDADVEELTQNFGDDPGGSSIFD